MTLPQRSTASKAILLFLLPVFAGFAVPALALEDGNRQTLFSCGTDEANDRGFLDLAGIPGEDDAWVDLRFDRTDAGDGHLVYSFPRGAVDARTAFLFSHSNGAEGYFVSIRWEDDGLDYVYYSLATPPDPALEDDMGGGAAGLAISRGGELVERVACIERPHMFIDYMREAMSCDTDNLYGPAACAAETYERSISLDVTRLGIVD